MKSVIWVETLEGNHYEIGNGSKLYFTIETLDNSILDTKAYDIIQYDITRKLLTSSDIRVVYRSEDKNKSQFIYDFLWGKILERKSTLEERWALKKIKGLENMVEERDRKLRNELFVVKIEDILKQYENKKYRDCSI